MPPVVAGGKGGKKGGKSTSRSAKAGLQFPEGQVAKISTAAVVVSRKRKASSAEDLQPPMDSFVQSVLRKLKEELQEEAKSRLEEMKTLNWTYDPRPPIDSVVYLRQFLEKVSPTAAATSKVIDALTAVFARECDSEIDGIEPVADFAMNVQSDVAASASAFDDEELIAVAVHCFLDRVPVDNLLAVWNADRVAYASAATNAQVLSLLSDNLSFSGILRDYPQFGKSVFEVGPIPEIDDDIDEEKRWDQKFSDHMIWLFSALENLKCNTYGRIKTAFGGSDFERMRNIESDNLAEGFTAYVQKKYNGKALEKLSEESIHALCIFETLNSRVDPRTYLYEFCFITRESDYNGTRSRIAREAGDMAEAVNDIGKFLQCLLMRKSVSELEEQTELSMTIAFYVPGMEPRPDMG